MQLFGSICKSGPHKCPVALTRQSIIIGSSCTESKEELRRDYLGKVTKPVGWSESTKGLFETSGTSGKQKEV